MMNRRTYGVWKKRIAAQVASGLSQKAYCRANQLSYAQFKYYRHRLGHVRMGEQTLNLSSSDKVQTNTPEPTPEKVSFCEVKRIQATPKKSPEQRAPLNHLKLILPSGIVCYVPVGEDKQQWGLFLKGLLR